ncbi:MAG: glucosaminidase domain-containing protein [Bacilli bacterium]
MKHLKGKLKKALVICIVALLALIGFSQAGILFSENGRDVITISTTKKIFDPNKFVASMATVATSKETTTLPITTVPVTTTQKVTKIVTTTKDTKLVFEGKTVTEIGSTLDKSLSGVLKGKGSAYAQLSLEKGMDPYLVAAISVHETGNGSSSLAKNKYNLGGIKCSSNRYCSYESIEDGISSYVNLIYNNYFSKGLTTIELMANKYAASPAWPSTVNDWYNSLKNK